MVNSWLFPSSAGLIKMKCGSPSLLGITSRYWHWKTPEICRWSGLRHRCPSSLDCSHTFGGLFESDIARFIRTCHKDSWVYKMLGRKRFLVASSSYKRLRGEEGFFGSEIVYRIRTCYRGSWVFTGQRRFSTALSHKRSRYGERYFGSDVGNLIWTCYRGPWIPKTIGQRSFLSASSHSLLRSKAFGTEARDNLISVHWRQRLRNWRRCSLSSSTVNDCKYSSAHGLRDLVALADIDPLVLNRIEKVLSSQTLASVSRAVNNEALMMKNAKPTKPTPKQLFLVALSPIPLFVVFGIIDNSVMILAGESFDRTLGITFGISTMAAAALGNLVSDVLGLGVGGMVEDWFDKIKLYRDPGLSRAQISMSIVRRWRFAGNVIGVSIGCIIGMFPLLFIDFDKVEALKRASAMDGLLLAVVEYVSKALKAEDAILFVVDPENNEIWTRASNKLSTEKLQASIAGTREETVTKKDGNESSFREIGDKLSFPIDSGIAGYCARTGDIVNICESDQTIPGLESKSDAVSGKKNHSMLCVPIFGRDHKVIGVVQVSNRIVDKDSEGGSGSFSDSDELALSAMTSHISVALERALHGAKYSNPLSEKESLLQSLTTCFEHHEHHQRCSTHRDKQ